MKKGIKVILGIVISLALVIGLGISDVVPYFAVIPDMVEVGLDYISLDRNPDYPKKAELVAELQKNSEKEVE